MCRLRRSARTAHQTSVRMRPSTRQNRSPRWKKSEKSRASWSLGIPFFAVRDADAEDVSVLDAVLDVEAQHAQRRAEGIARLETVCDEKEIGRVLSGRRRLGPMDADRGTEIHVVDEPMLERDVGLQWSGAVPPGLLAVFGRFPRLTEDDPSARRRPAFDWQGHVLELDDL